MLLAARRLTAPPLLLLVLLVLQVVLVNGGPLAIKELKQSSQVGAILEAFMPGQAAAEATFQLLLGLHSPSGLLPVTVYDADYIDRRPVSNLDLRGAGGVTYRYFAGVPLWPFGHGLSYGEVEFSLPAKAGPPTTIHTTVAKARSQPLCFTVTVKNGAGARMATDVVVLGFIASQLPDSPRNPKLCDFQRESAVLPGEQRHVQLCANALGALALVDTSGAAPVERILPGEYTLTVGVGGSGSVGGTGAGGTIGKLLLRA